MQTLINLSRIRIWVFLMTYLVGVSAVAFSQHNPTNPPETPPDMATAGIRILHSGSDIQLNEGGISERYAVKLCSKPEADVIVSMFTHSEVILSQTDLVFTPANWNTPQVITLSVPDNSQAEAARTRSITHTPTSTDPDYNRLPDIDLSVDIQDNDTPSVLITQSGSGTMLNEGLGEDTITIQLSTAPIEDVNIILSSGLRIHTVPSRLCFTPQDWASPRVVTLTAADDSLANESHTGTIGAAVISADPEYDRLDVSEVRVRIADNDVPGLLVSDHTGTGMIASPEGLMCDIRLTRQPSADVHIDIHSRDCVEVSNTSLTISPSGWNTNQRICLRARTGACGSDCLLFQLKSHDPAFDGLEVPSLIVTIPAENPESSGNAQNNPGDKTEDTDDYPVTTSKSLGSGCFISGLLH